jgi:hypothetical protein
MAGGSPWPNENAKAAPLGGFQHFGGVGSWIVVSPRLRNHHLIVGALVFG